MLHVHRAADAARLVDALAGVLAEPAADDPFAPEVVAVPSHGIERWLAQELSLRVGTSGTGRDGVCANVSFPFPATVVGWGVHATPQDPADVTGRTGVAHPWDPAGLTWTLLDVLEQPGEHGVPLREELGAFGAHVSGERGRARRLPALRHVADLFDRYAVHRPAMVRAWRDHDDVDGVGRPLPETARWQPHLWRAVHRRLGPSFVEQVAGAVDRLAAGAPVPGVPSRVVLYGLTALPATYVDLLRAMGTAHDVHLFLLHPSPALWDAVAPHVVTRPRPARADDDTRALPQHPLLASWGRDARELQRVLGPVDHDRPAPGTSPWEERDGLLAHLQRALVADDPPPGAPVPGADDRRVPVQPTVPPDTDRPRRAVDTSLQVHACHGRLRQVEVLRDAVFGLMSDDPTIQPRDVVVMCPDVESFAPLVDAVFGADTHVAEVDGTEVARGLPDVRVRLADRSLRQVNPLLRTLADLLALPDGRVEATTVLDLARRQPVRARFGLDDDDLATLEDWVGDLAVRWGLDADHRARHGLATDANTWRRGLERLLLGVAVPERGPRVVAGLLPHDDVEGSAVDLAGRLAELVDRIARVVDGLADPRAVADWCADLRTAADLLTTVAPDEAWQRVQLDRLVDDLLEAAGGEDAPDVPVTLAELRALLDDRLRGRPSRANHRTGDLTVCTLVPMRSVPYRVVCLLGLDDETFPRRTVPSGDDLIAQQPVVGDRDPRTEDRQLLLDAVLAAREHLVITYRGRDEKTDAAVPPAVPVAELLDVVDAMARPADGAGDARDLVVRHHPLRAADLRTFHPDDPFGFDPVAEAGARARSGPPRPEARFLDPDRVPPPLAATTGPTVVEWDDFVRFLDKPVKGYLRARLGISLRSAEDPVDDLLPVDLGGLDQWGIGTRLLEGALRDDLDAWLVAERARGALPVDAIGRAALDEVTAEVERLRDVALAEYGDRVRGRGRPVEVDLRVGDLHLVGVVPDVGDDLLVRLDYGHPKPKRLLKLWLPWLVLHAQGVGRTAVLLTRGKKNTKETSRWSWFDADLGVDESRRCLQVLADLYVSGHDHPLAVFEETTPAFAVARHTGKDRAAALRTVSSSWKQVNFQTGSRYGDGHDEHVTRVFGNVEFADVLAITPRDDEAGEGWVMDEPSRFGRLAHRLWDPLFAVCTSEGTR